MSNGHGDTTQLTDSSGGKKAEYRYDAFGNQFSTNTEYNPFQYSGEYTDEEAGFTYVDAVGKNTKAIKTYIEEQLKRDRESDQISMFDPRDPFTGK